MLEAEECGNRQNQVAVCVVEEDVVQQTRNGAGSYLLNIPGQPGFLRISDIILMVS
jgi:hypothetical protein